MSCERTIRRLAAGIIIATLVVVLTGQTARASDEVETAIIAHPSVSDTTLADQDIQNAFLGKKTEWSNGQSLVLVTLSEKTVHESFLRQFIKKTPSQFRIFWKRLAFAGKAAPPKELDTEQDVIDFVTKNEGAVGYVSLTKAKASGCKILAQHGEK